MRELWDQRFTPADHAIIQQKAWKLVGHYGYRSSDVDDIRQELALRIFPRTGGVNPARGSRAALVSTIAGNEIIHLIEHRTAQRRDPRRQRSIGDVGDSVLIASHQGIDQLDLQLDVREALQSLPAECREIADRRAWQSVAAIARDMGLSRAMVRHRLELIRRRLIETGLNQNQAA